MDEHSLLLRSYRSGTRSTIGKRKVDPMHRWTSDRYISSVVHPRLTCLGGKTSRVVEELFGGDAEQTTT